MADNLRALAHPHKSFFVEMFTRDISLEECLLDLIDNPIDGLIRKQGIELDKSLLEPNSSAAPNALKIITLNIGEKSVEVIDNCGGISLAEAKAEIFNFGHTKKYHDSAKNVRLGIYGVGLKRALFKLGTDIEVTSRTTDDGFSMKVNLEEWMKEDTLKDWTFPLRELEPTSSKKAGTTIRVSSLRETTKSAIGDPQFLHKLRNEIGRAYSLFLERYVSIVVNGKPVLPLRIPFGASDEISPAFKELTDDGVKVHLFASLASRSANREWPAEQAGWYIACNGRLVVIADKSELTGWNDILPAFHTGKFRGFVGLAMFSSDDPLKLPWTTKKSGLDKENMVYQRVRHQMAALTRPIITFLNKMYSGEIHETPTERAMADAVKSVDVRALASGAQTPFGVTPNPDRREQTTVKVQYHAERQEIELIRKHLLRPDLSASAIGKLTLEEFIKRNDLR